VLCFHWFSDLHFRSNAKFTFRHFWELPAQLVSWSAPVLHLVIFYSQHMPQAWGLTPRSWALLERSLAARTFDGFPAFYGTRRFNTEFTRALHLCLSWARQIQFTSTHSPLQDPYYYPTTYVLVFLVASFFLAFPPATYMRSSSSLFVLHEQFTSPHPAYTRSFLMLSTHLRLGLPSGLLSSGFPTNLYVFPFFLIRARCTVHITTSHL
jgi:hypothetical protein